MNHRATFIGSELKPVTQLHHAVRISEMAADIITDYDRHQAQTRAKFTLESFRRVLRQDLRICLDGRQRVLIDEFISYFNKVNVERGCKTLDTRGVKYGAFFEALDNVCKVDDQYKYLYPVTGTAGGSRAPSKVPAVSKSHPTSAESPRRLQSMSPPPDEPPRSHSLSPPVDADRRNQRSKSSTRPMTAPETETPRNLNITEVQRMLVGFIHSLSNTNTTEVSWETFCTKLREHDRQLYESFLVFRSAEKDRVQFIEEHVAGHQNKIDVEKSGGVTTLIISKCKCCGSRPSSPPVDVVSSEEDDDKNFSFALGHFKNIELPLEDWIEVQVSETDSWPRRLRMKLVWRNRQFEKLHEELSAEYAKNALQVADVKVGLFCAVPFEGTKDYHRGIVMNASDPSLPVVLYVDLGIIRGVAKGCIRKLHKNFLTVPTFCVSGEVVNSPPFAERLHLERKLWKKESVMVCATKFDNTKGRYLLRLDTDSGIMSDASRD